MNNKNTIARNTPAQRIIFKWDAYMRWLDNIESITEAEKKQLKDTRIPIGGGVYVMPTKTYKLN